MKYFVIAALLLAGCEPTGEHPSKIFPLADSKYKVVLLVDMTPSFAEFMAEHGYAYQFLLELVDVHFRDTIGSASERIIIAQISPEKPFVIWEGTAMELRKQFDPQKFAALLREHSDSNGGSPVFKATAATLEYLLADPSVAAGKTKPVFCILSDMWDTDPKPPELKARVLRDLGAFGKLNGTFAIYYCHSKYLVPWTEALKDAGITDAHVESSAVSKPVLPAFE